MDYLLRVTAAAGQIRGFFAATNETVQTAHNNYKTTPVVTAALGRTLTGTAIMGAMLKNDKDVLTVAIRNKTGTSRKISLLLQFNFITIKLSCRQPNRPLPMYCMPFRPARCLPLQFRHPSMQQRHRVLHALLREGQRRIQT